MLYKHMLLHPVCVCVCVCACVYRANSSSEVVVAFLTAIVSKQCSIKLPNKVASTNMREHTAGLILLRKHPGCTAASASVSNETYQ